MERELERFVLIPKFFKSPLNSNTVIINYYNLRY